MDDTMSKVRFAAIGLNHFHIYGQIDLMLRAGAEFAAYCGEEEKFFDRPFAKHYPQARRLRDRLRILHEQRTLPVLSGPPHRERPPPRPSATRLHAALLAAPTLIP